MFLASPCLILLLSFLLAQSGFGLPILRLVLLNLLFLICLWFLHFLTFLGNLSVVGDFGLALLFMVFFLLGLVFDGGDCLFLFFLLLQIDFTANHALNMLLSLLPSTSSSRAVEFSRYICQQLLTAKYLIFMTPTFSSVLSVGRSVAAVGGEIFALMVPMGPYFLVMSI